MNEKSAWQIGTQDRTLIVAPSGQVSLNSVQTGEVLFDGLVCGYETAEGQVLFAGRGQVTKGRYQEQMGEGEEVVIELPAGEHGLSATWTLRLVDGRSAMLARIEVTNKGPEPVTLKAILPLVPGPGDGSGGLQLALGGELRCLQCQPHSWRDTELYFLDGTALSGLVTAVADARDRGFVAGFLTFEKYLGEFETYEPNGQQERVRVRAFHRFDKGLTLAPGQALASEWVWLDPCDDVLRGLEDWADVTGKLNGAVFASPQATGFYTWYYYRESVSEEIVLQNARFLAANRDRFPVNYIHLDFGWQRDGSCGETETTAHFPHGLEWLASEIRKLGFVPSLWLNAFMVDYPTARVYKERPELFQQDEDGNPKSLGLGTRGPKSFGEPIRNVMGRLIANYHTGVRPGQKYQLDATLDATREYLRERYAWARSMGYGMVMLDFLDSGLPADDAVVADRSMTEIETVRAGMEAVREGIEDEVMILCSGAYYLPVIGTGNLVRTAGDIPAHWKYVSRGCRQQLLQYFMHQRLFTAYADCFVLRGQPSPYWDSEPSLSNFYMTLSVDEARFYTAVTGLSGITVMVSEDVSELAPERQWLLSLVLPIYDGGQFRPVDLFQGYHPSTLELKLNAGGRVWIVAAGLNWENLEVETALHLERLDLDPDRTYHGFDVFGQDYLGQFAGRETIGPASPRSGRVVNLVAVEDHPQVVGTDLHITQGAVEIASETWQAAEGTLTIGLNDLQGRRGHLWIWVPEEFEFDDADSLAVAQVDEPGSQLLQVSVILDGEKTVSLTFASR